MSCNQVVFFILLCTETWSSPSTRTSGHWQCFQRIWITLVQLRKASSCSFHAFPHTLVHVWSQLPSSHRENYLLICCHWTESYDWGWAMLRSSLTDMLSGPVTFHSSNEDLFFRTSTSEIGVNVMMVLICCTLQSKKLTDSWSWSVQLLKTVPPQLNTSVHFSSVP